MKLFEDTPEFIVADGVLSLKGKFTVDDLCNSLNKELTCHLCSEEEIRAFVIKRLKIMVQLDVLKALTTDECFERNCGKIAE